MNCFHRLATGCVLLIACGGSTAVDSKSSTSTSTTTSAATSAGGAGQVTSSGGQIGQGGAVATSASSSGGAGGGGADCKQPCIPGLKCCKGKCVNFNNDILNCGGCGSPCGPSVPYCMLGLCTSPPCDSANACIGTTFCCGAECCKLGDLCCNVPGPIEMGPKCTTPTAEGSCPPGCPECKCAAPDLPVATPGGERRIADLRPGDAIYSIHRGKLRAVPVRSIKRLPVSNHRVMRITLDNGRTIDVSAEHPLADGSSVGSVRAGDLLHGVRVLAAELVPYAHGSTYDVLPDSDTGTYFAAGALIGSTMYGPVRVPDQCFDIRP